MPLTIMENLECSEALSPSIGKSIPNKTKGIQPLPPFLGHRIVGACKLQVERTQLRTASHRFGKNPQD